jgi:hypothetical protein
MIQNPRGQVRQLLDAVLAAERVVQPGSQAGRGEERKERKESTL